MERSWAEENLPVPATLEAAVAERNGWVESAMQFSRNADYYRGLVVKIGELLGPEAYVSDDGTVQADVLCAKVLELIADRLAREVSDGAGGG